MRFRFAATILVLSAVTVTVAAQTPAPVPQTGAWAERSRSAEFRSEAATAVLNGKVYLFGGLARAYLWRATPTKLSWRTLALFWAGVALGLLVSHGRFFLSMQRPASVRGVRLGGGAPPAPANCSPRRTCAAIPQRRARLGPRPGSKGRPPKAALPAGGSP